MIECRRRRRSGRNSRLSYRAAAHCAYFSINAWYSSMAGNFANLWGAGVVAHGSFSLVYVSMNGQKPLGSFSIVARTFTKSNPSGRVNIQLMQ